MINQYPDTIIGTVVPAVAQAPYQDVNGDWQTPGNISGVEITQVCRAEPMKFPLQIAGKDGVFIEYRLLVYLPLGSIPLVINSAIVIKDSNGDKSAVGFVRRFEEGQFNCRIWV